MENAKINAEHGNTAMKAAANQVSGSPETISPLRISEQEVVSGQQPGRSVPNELKLFRNRQNLSPFSSLKKTGNLPDHIQAKMERSFGEDFSDVKVFKNSDVAGNMKAIALTQENNIHFAPGYNPFSAEGEDILGHELAHVVQQRQGRVSPTHYEAGMGVNDAKELEAEADSFGHKAALGEIINMNHISQPTKFAVQKKSSVVQMWRPLPGQARVESTEPDIDGAMRAVRGAIANATGSWVDDIASEFRSAFIGRISEELSGGLGTITFNNFKTYSGFNLTWWGDIQFKIDGIRPISGGGTGSTVMGAGGSTTTGVSNKEGISGGTSGGGTVSSTPGSGGGTGGSLTAGVTSGTSSERTESSSHTSNATNTSTVKQALTRYRSSIACFVNLSSESSVGDSGWDYVNPLQWGVALGDAIVGVTHGSASTNCGTVTYYVSEGIVP